MTTITPPICAVRDEALRSRDDPPVSRATGRRPHRGGVAAGIRLGEPPRAEDFSTGEPWQIAPLLRLRAEERDVRGAQPVVRRNRERDRRAHPCDLFDADAIVHRRHARAAVLVRDLDAQQVQAGELLQQIHRKVLRLVPLHDVRADFAFRERAHRATQDFLLLGRPKVHGTRLPRRHRAAGLWIDRRMRYDRAMTTRVFRTVLACVVALLVYPSTARADITGFLGVTTTPSSRPAVGFAVGAGLLIVGAEFEYSHSNEDLTELAPSLRTFMFNGLLQTPDPDRRHSVLRRSRWRRLPRDAVGRRQSLGDELRHQHRRRRQDLACRSAAPAARLPRVHAEGQPRSTRTCSGCMRD